MSGIKETIAKIRAAQAADKSGTGSGNKPPLGKDSSDDPLLHTIHIVKAHPVIENGQTTYFIDIVFAEDWRNRGTPDGNGNLDDKKTHDKIRTRVLQVLAGQPEIRPNIVPTESDKDELPKGRGFSITVKAPDNADAAAYRQTASDLAITISQWLNDHHYVAEESNRRTKTKHGGNSNNSPGSGNPNSRF